VRALVSSSRFAHLASVQLSLTHTRPSLCAQADGIVCVKTTQAVLVAEYAHPTVPGEATKIVEVRPLPPALSSFVEQV